MYCFREIDSSIIFFNEFIRLNRILKLNDNDIARDLDNKVSNSLRLALRYLYIFNHLFDLVEKRNYLSRINEEDYIEY